MEPSAYTENVLPFGSIWAASIFNSALAAAFLAPAMIANAGDGSFPSAEHTPLTHASAAENPIGAPSWDSKNGIPYSFS